MTAKAKKRRLRLIHRRNPLVAKAIRVVFAFNHDPAYFEARHDGRRRGEWTEDRNRRDDIASAWGY